VNKLENFVLFIEWFSSDTSKTERFDTGLID